MRLCAISSVLANSCHRVCRPLSRKRPLQSVVQATSVMAEQDISLRDQKLPMCEHLRLRLLDLNSQRGSTTKPMCALVCQVVHHEEVSLAARSQLLGRLIGFQQNRQACLHGACLRLRASAQSSHDEKQCSGYHD